MSGTNAGLGSDDNPRRLVSDAAFDVLFSEIVAYTGSYVAHTASHQAGGLEGMMGNGVDRRDGAVTDSGETGLIDRSSAALGIGDAPLPAEQAHAMEGRIESMGYEVGYRLVERTCQQRWMAGDHLEAIKFVCKDLWVELFKKQVDKLQTDHRGTFVLKDANFLWTLRYASDDTPGSRDLVGRLLHFPCGLVRGALANLGMIAAVRADFVNESGEASVLPAVSFTIKVKTPT